MTTNIPFDSDKINKSTNLTKREYEYPEFSSEIFSDGAYELALSDIVVVYSDGKSNKIIPLELFKIHPIFFDTYFDTSDKTVHDITVSVCPYTLCTTVFFNKYYLTDKIYLNQIVLEKEEDKHTILVPLVGYHYSLDSNKLLDQTIRRGEAKIVILRDAISKFADVKYIKFTNKSKLQPIKGSKISNSIPYGITYISGKIETENKHALILPKNKSLSIKENGIDEYFNNMVDKIREKGGIMIPCLKKPWIKFFPNSKIIKL